VSFHEHTISVSITRKRPLDGNRIADRHLFSHPGAFPHSNN
jgi:hypothetical protein